MLRISLRILLVVAAVSLNGCARSFLGSKPLAFAALLPQSPSVDEAQTKRMLAPTPPTSAFQGGTRAGTKDGAEVVKPGSNAIPAGSSSRQGLNGKPARDQSPRATRASISDASTSPAHTAPAQASPELRASERLPRGQLDEFLRVIRLPDSQLSPRERDYKRILAQAVSEQWDATILAGEVHQDQQLPHPAAVRPVSSGREDGFPDSSKTVGAKVKPVAAPDVATSPSPASSHEDRSRAPTSSKDDPTAASPPEPSPDTSSVSAENKLPEVRPGEWRDHIGKGLTTLELETSRFAPQGRERERLGVNKRMLHLLLNQREDAVAEIGGMDDDQREFWKHQFAALALAVDAEDKHTTSRRAALALRELRDAADYLANMSSLDVRNLAFCERVESFGRYTPFKSTSFKPGQELLLYVEIDNFTVRAVGDRFETELQAEYNLVGTDGYRTNSKLATVKEEGRNRRHDYFVAYSLNLPKDLAPGQYTLQLIVEDVKGQKSSQGSLDFKVR